MNLMFVMLQAAAPNGGMGGSGLIWIIIIFVVMWFLLLHPQRKKEKEEKKFREGLKKGDRVLFSGGIFGKVHEVGEHTVEVEVSNGVVLTVEKSMIQPAPENKNAETK